MTLDQTANEKKIKMVLCKFIQSWRVEMARDTGSWITMNHMHTALHTHSTADHMDRPCVCTCMCQL